MVDWLIEYGHAPPKDSALQIVCYLSFIRALDFRYRVALFKSYLICSVPYDLTKCFRSPADELLPAPMQSNPKG